MDSPPIACKVATFPPRGKMRTTRCDLHIHSAASLGNDEWYTRLFGWPESYAEPARQYDLCKARGMSLVTLTDHDTIDGGLTLIDRPDFFLSEEVTTRFPENGCVMHVLAWNITRDQHDEIQARRNDIYRLCEYLNGAAIAHGLAHPLISPNAGLDAATFEKVLLMFPTFEGTNGRTDRRIEPDLTTMLERLTPEVIAALARKHGIAPNGPAPHRKALTAGSDDHGDRRAATIYTEVDGADLDPAAFLRGCMAGLGRTVGNVGTAGAPRHRGDVRLPHPPRHQGAAAGRARAVALRRATTTRASSTGPRAAPTRGSSRRFASWRRRPRPSISAAS